MNELNPTAGPIPPAIQTPPRITKPLPLGEDPADREPISGPLVAVEAILRAPRRIMYQLRQRGSGGLIFAMLVVAILCSLIYGLVVGTFSMGTQLWAAPVKIAGGLLVTALICLPSLYIFTCLSGSEAKLSEIFGLITGLLMLMTILLIGFAPVAWLFSQSTNSVIWMGVLHLIFWFISTMFGLKFLDSGFSHYKAKTSAGLYTWVIIFILVAVQMTTALRPIVGTSDSFFPKEKKFFLSHWGDSLSAPAAPAVPAGQ